MDIAKSFPIIAVQRLRSKTIVIPAAVDNRLPKIYMNNGAIENSQSSLACNKTSSKHH